MYLDYALAVIMAVFVSSVALLLVLRKQHLLSLQLLIGVALSALSVSLLFPFTCYILFENERLLNSGMGVWAVIFIAFILHTLLILVFTLMIASSISEQKLRNIVRFLKEKIYRLLPNQPMRQHTLQEVIMETSAIGVLGEAQEYTVVDTDTEEKKKTNSEEYINILEKSVDSSANTDTMGIETANIHQKDEYAVLPEDVFHSEGVLESQDISFLEATEDEMVNETPSIIESYFDEAFCKKQSGDLEDAILYFMYAMDLKPEKELVFWIVIEICAIYKTLGQTALAMDILNSYRVHYGDHMEESVKLEIEKNLLYI